MSEVAIRARGLAKRYRLGTVERYRTFRETLVRAVKSPFTRSKSPPDEFWALRDVSFEVERGEVIGVIGRNGAGKSTLLKVLSRITDPTAGYVDVVGRVGSLLEVGTGFHNELSGRDNIYLNGSILGMKRGEIRRKFDEIVAFSECERFLDTPVKRYSSGMYMRLAFAVAAHLEPEILVVDEVLAVGDAAFQKKCLGKMNDVASHGRTVLFVSHNMAAVQGLCRRAIWLDRGQIVRCGATAEVVREYLQGGAADDDDGATPLADRADRRGDGTIRLTSIDIRTTDGDRVIGAGCRLRIALGYRSDRPITNGGFLLTVHDLTGVPLLLLNSDFTHDLPESLPAEGTVTCVTDPINLTAGRCYVTAEAFRGPITADEVENAAAFDVERVDFYGTGKVPRRNRAMWLVRHQWSAGGGERG